MESILRVLSSASGVTIAMVVALTLMGITALLMPRRELGQLKVPLGFLLLHLLLRAVELLLEHGAPMQRTVALLALGALLVSIGRTTVLLVLDIVLGRRLERQLPKIIRDIIQGLVYFVLLLALLRQMGLEPGQLLTTSALLTAVIGLSLQDTLGNLIAGLSVQIQRPFSVGDWIQFDDEAKNIGRVVEINWRATTMVTLDEVEVVVPNGTLAKAALRVYTRPSPVVRRSVYVSVEYAVPPHKVQQTILEAIRGAPGVLNEPPPTVVTNVFGDSGIEYWVRIYTDQFQRRDMVDGGVRDRIWYGLQRAGISIPYPHRVVHVVQKSEEARLRALEDTIAKRERALLSVEFLKVMSPEQRRELAARATTRLFSRGEVVVRQGEETDELFLILSGEAIVLLEGEKSDNEVARLGPGKFFGEMALVTGEKRKATVKAARDLELLVINHDAFEKILHERPEVVDALSELLAERQLQLDATAARFTPAERRDVMMRETSQLLGQIKRLFKLS